MQSSISIKEMNEALSRGPTEVLAQLVDAACTILGCVNAPKLSGHVEIHYHKGSPKNLVIVDKSIKLDE